MATRLSKIYTKTGDLGTTALADGARIPKTDTRIVIIGEVDHLNALFGLVRCESLEPQLEAHFNTLQHLLFDLGGELCMPALISLKSEHIQWLEDDIDRMNETLPTLKDFILPGGSPAAAQLHVARTTTRKLECQMIEHHEQHSLRQDILIFINRLSDWLFVAARSQLKFEQQSEVLWNNPYKK